MNLRKKKKRKRRKTEDVYMESKARTSKVKQLKLDIRSDLKELIDLTHNTSYVNILG